MNLEAQSNVNLSGAESVNFYDAYARWTDSVAKYPPTAEPFYLALGIADEAGEYADVRLHRSSADHKMKEAGDVMWYVARYSRNVLGVPFSDLINDANNARGNGQSLATLTGTVAGVEKKRIRDGELWDAAKLADKNGASYRALTQIVHLITEEMLDLDFTLQEVLEANVKKLSARLESGTIRGDGEDR